MNKLWKWLVCIFVAKPVGRMSRADEQMAAALHALSVAIQEKGESK